MPPTEAEQERNRFYSDTIGRVTAETAAERLPERLEADRRRAYWRARDRRAWALREAAS